MNRINFSRVEYKDWIGLLASPIFWISSLICFVMGLAFKQGTGILIPGTSLDLILIFSIALGFANTAIQIVGNDTDREDLGMPLFLMWGASYMLGIGSNVNFLYSAIGLNNAFLQFLVCWGLGIMIEVAPERLLVRFLRQAGVLGAGIDTVEKSQPKQNYQGNNQQPHRYTPTTPNRDERHSQLRKAPTPIPNSNRYIEDDKLSNYTPIGNPNKIKVTENIPDFLRKRK